MKQQVNIGLIGFGTVGGGLFALLKQNSELIFERTAVRLRVTTVCDKRVDYVKSAVPSDVRITDDWRSVIEDPSIDTVVELIGGIEPAKSIILAALGAGKNVVSANKKLLAEAGDEILALADRKEGKLAFEAAVGGGIPCLEALKNGLVGNNLQCVMGILNGTTNYILTKMEQQGLTFASALQEAQQKGFAEADPTFDIEGYDAGHKICLLAMIAFNKKISYKDIGIEGITRLTADDFRFARSLGYAIKLLGIARMTATGEIDVRVHPTMIPLDHQLAEVDHEFNAVLYEGDMTGPVLLYGRGAGALPTASAVVSDIVQMAVKSEVRESAISINGRAALLHPHKRILRYYFRLHTEDRAGILEKIAGAFAENNISIASMEQPNTKGSPVTIFFLTHAALEEGVVKSVEKINSFDFVKEPVLFIRVEDSENGTQQ